MAMWGRRLIALTSMLIWAGTTIPSMAQEEILCMNQQCFKSDRDAEAQRSAQLREDSLTINPFILPPLYSAPETNAETETLEYLSSPAYSQNSDASKYFVIVNNEVPAFKKRFMNVRAYDIDYGTNPDFESVRPSIGVDLFPVKPSIRGRRIWK